MTRTWINHNRQSKYALALGAAALSLLTLAPRPAAAAPAGSGPVIGSVDILKLQTQSTRKARYDAELRTLQDKLSASLQAQAKYPMLPAPELTELGTLVSSPRPSESDRARVTALETKSEQTSQQFIALQQKKDPTPADTAELGRLTDLGNASQNTLKNVSDSYQAQLKKLNDADTTAFTQIVKEAIAASAQQHGLTVVLTSDIAVYTTNDITDDVIKRVNNAK